VIPRIRLRKALSDPQLLGGAVKGESWQAWRALLVAAMGEELTSKDVEIFRKLTGRQREPRQRVEELVCVIGRRGGKSRAMATLACYIAGLCEHDLAPGERGVALLIAPDQRQAKIALDYATAVFENSPVLRQLIGNRTQDELELKNGIAIEVRAASFRRLRGPTYVAVFADEAAFWPADEWSSNPDVEILNAVRPGLATTQGPLIIASSPYARRGVLFESFKRHHGPDGDPLILVAKGTSRELNPSLAQTVVDRALERDRISAAAKYLAEFRADIEGFVRLEVVQACLGDFFEAAPASGCKYSCFVDPSGGSADSFALAIAHQDADKRVVVDAVRETRPPFSPENVIIDFAALCKGYRVTRVSGDRYAGEFPREVFRKYGGITYELATKTKSDLFRDLLPLLNSGRIVLPKNERLVHQLCGLERRVSRAGKDSIDHGLGGHDDLANAVAGVCDMIVSGTGSYNWESMGS
jgi:hypothetical protein